MPLAAFTRPCWTPASAKLAMSDSKSCIVPQDIVPMEHANANTSSHVFHAFAVATAPAAGATLSRIAAGTSGHGFLRASCNLTIADFGPGTQPATVSIAYVDQ